MKSYWISLYLLVFGGVFGLHHFYLGRIRHGIFCLFTLGGCLLGLLHDFARLRFYVNWANFDADFKEEYLAMIRKNPEPSIGFWRSIAVGLGAEVFGSLVQAAIPADLLDPWSVTAFSTALVPSAVATAVWCIGCVGEIHGPFLPTLKAALWTSPVYIWTPAQMFTTLVCTHVFGKSCSYRVQPEKSRSVWYKVSYTSAFLVLICLLCSSMLMFNCTLEDETEEPVKCRDALKHFFHSPKWQNIVESFTEIYNALREDGFVQFLHATLMLMDPTGEQYALYVLRLSHEASNDEIRKAYRELSRKFHPDKNMITGQNELEEAELRFMKIQNAYQTLRLTKAAHRNVEL